MAIELIKDILKVDEIKGKEEVQTLAETEVYLNQTKPDIQEILWTDGKVEIMNSKIIKDGIIVSGIVNFKVVYRPKEENVPIQTLETTSDFKEEIEIEGIDEEMMGVAKAHLEHIEYEVEDERKVVLEALINIEAKVEKSNSIEIVKDIKGGEGLEVLKEKVKYNHFLGASDSYVIVREAFEIRDDMPSIEEVLKLNLNAYEKELKVVDDRIIVSGIVEASIIYYGEGKLNTIKREISFNHFIDVEGAVRDSNCQLKLEIASGEYEIKEDIEGNLRILDLEIKVKTSGKVYEQREKEMILDAYSTKKKVNISKEEIEMTENVMDLHEKETVKGTLMETGFKEVYNIEGNPVLLDSRILEDKILLEGLVSLNILYLDLATGMIKNLKEEMPFKVYVEAKGIDETMKAEIEMHIEEISYNISDGKLEIETNIDNIIFLNRSKKVDIILDLEETEEYIDKRKRPSITIYIVQKGDNLWDIAKRYNTTVEELIHSNNILSTDNLMPGEKIIIEKNVDINF